MIALLLLLALQDKAALPDEASRKAADKLVRDIFKDDLAKVGSTDRSAFIRKLLQQAAENRADPANCYALFSLAQDQAAAIGDADLLWKAADDAAAVFRVEPAILKEAALQKFSLRTPEESRRAIAGFLRVVPEFLAAGEFERAEKAAATAAALARRIKDIPFSARGDAAVKEAAALKEKFKGLAQARTTLAAQPDDPAANAVVGRYDCFIKGDWAAGLPRLAKGSDAATKDPAVLELAVPTDPAKMLAVADAWNALAEKESGPVRLTILRHAAVLYRAAAPGLTGLTKLKIEKRIEEIAKEAGGADEVDLLKIIDVDKDRLNGAFTRSGSSIVTGDKNAMVELFYTPPEEYDLKATAARRPGGGDFLIFGFIVGGRTAVLSIDQDGKESLLGPVVGNRAFALGRQMTGDREFKILINVRKGSVGFSIDGKRIFDWQGEVAQVARNPTFHFQRSDDMFLGAAPSWEVRQFTLIPVTGTGKIVR
jgi:hypothetical protein